MRCHVGFRIMRCHVGFRIGYFTGRICLGVLPFEILFIIRSGRSHHVIIIIFETLFTIRSGRSHHVIIIIFEILFIFFIRSGCKRHGITMIFMIFSGIRLFVPLKIFSIFTHDFELDNKKISRPHLYPLYFDAVKKCARNQRYAVLERHLDLLPAKKSLVENRVDRIDLLRRTTGPGANLKSREVVARNRTGGTRDIIAGLLPGIRACPRGSS